MRAPRGLSQLEHGADEGALRLDDVLLQQHAGAALVEQSCHAVHRNVDRALLFQQQWVLLRRCAHSQSHVIRLALWSCSYWMDGVEWSFQNDLWRVHVTHMIRASASVLT